jgi:hypothetical protein
MPTAWGIGGVRVGRRGAGDEGFCWRVVVIVCAGVTGVRHRLEVHVARGWQSCDSGHHPRLVEVGDPGVLGTVLRPILSGFEHLLLAQCRFDAPHGVGSSLGDDAGLVCPARWLTHVRAFDCCEFVVGAPGDPLQVGLEMVSKAAGFGGRCREFGRPQPACHPRSAIDCRAKCRENQGFPCRCAQALAHSLSAENRHRFRLPAQHESSREATLRAVNDPW